MTTTNQAFIRAYGRLQDGHDVRNHMDGRATYDHIGQCPVGGIDWRTSVRIVGVDTEPSPPEVHVSASPAEPVFPASIRHQQQYYRLDQPPGNFGAVSGNLGPESMAPHFPPSQHSPLEHVAAVANRGFASSFVPSSRDLGSSLTTFHYPDVCRQLLQQASDAYDALADVVVGMVEEGRTLIGVAGALPAAGCTTTVLSLALRLLAAGKAIAVADANFSRPGIRNSLRVPKSTTWQEVLLNGSPIETALVRSMHDGLVVLPAGQDPSHCAPPAQLSMTAGALRYRFDATLIDLGAVLEPFQSAIARSVVQAMRIDGILLVTDGEQDLNHQRGHLEQFFHDCRCPTLGTIENFATGVGG